MAQWDTMVKLFDLTRKMAAEMAEGISEEAFDVASGEANSPKWIVGHLALGMDFGLMLLGFSSSRLDEMMPTYGPGSAGGCVGDDGRSKDQLIAQLRTTGDELRKKIVEADAEVLNAPQATSFFLSELPTVGDLLGHIVTTHLALHMGQLSQIRRDAGLPSWYQVK